MSRAPWPPFCDCCSEQLTEAGAILLAPPTAMGTCMKLHLCVRCFKGMVRNWFDVSLLAGLSGTSAADEVHVDRADDLTRFNCAKCGKPHYNHGPAGTGCDNFTWAATVKTEAKGTDP